MKRFVVFVIVPVLMLIGCSQEQKEVKLEQGTPAYQLAKDLVPILPLLDPDVNAVLIRTNRFTVTTGEIIQTLYANMGKRTDQLKTFDAERLRSIIDENATRLAERKLLMAEAKKAKSSVTQEEIDNILSLQYRRAGGEEKFLQILEENGIDIAFVKESIQKDLLIENYLNGYFTSKIPVSEEEVQTVYGEDKTASVRHILLMTQEKTDAEKEAIRKKMEEILSLAKSGEDFAELAKTYSEDPGSKDSGGLYENFGRGQMVKPFEEAAFALKPGEVSDVVETKFGYHLIKVIEKKPETTIAFEDIKDRLEQYLKQEKVQKEVSLYAQKLKEKAKVERFLTQDP